MVSLHHHLLLILNRLSLYSHLKCTFTSSSLFPTLPTHPNNFNPWETLKVLSGHPGECQGYVCTVWIPTAGVGTLRRDLSTYQVLASSVLMHSASLYPAVVFYPSGLSEMTKSSIVGLLKDKMT